MILTNRKQNFMLSKAVETGLSDFHKMVTTSMRNTYSRQEPIKIYYRNYSNFDKSKFIEDFEKSNYYPPQPKKDVNSEYNNLLTMIQKVLNRHAALKSRVVRGNHAPFMNKELSKAIMIRSQLETKYNKTKQEADRNACKKQRNLCVKLRRKAVKKYFVNKCRSGVMSNKNFWITVRPFISNKTNRNESDIILIEKNNVIKDRKNVANTFK